MAVMRLKRQQLTLWLMMTGPLLFLWYFFLRQDAAMHDQDSLTQKLQDAAKVFSRSPPRQPTCLEVFQRRSQLLREACLARPRGAAQRQPPLPYNTLWTKSMSFCALAKTGTTFWKRLLYYVDRGMEGPLLSHDFGDIHNKDAYMLKKNRFSTAQSYKSIAFVREPYARLLSAYVDKLFTPRADTWHKYAKPALEYARPGASRLERACSHNVTFPELVRYFIRTELDGLDVHSDRSTRRRRDEHFAPISQQCNFCGTSYDFLGRQETFAEDTLGILAQLNISVVLTFSDLDKEHEKYEMATLIRYTFENEIVQVADTRGCMSREEVLRRLWKAFQIRGTLGAEEFFPLAPSDTLNISKEDFLKIAMKTYDRSAGVPKRKSNKEESMLEAYSMISRSNRLLLRRIFDEDFKFFGYNPDHPLVFPPEDEFELPYYRYFDVFDSFLYSDVL